MNRLRILAFGVGLTTLIVCFAIADGLAVQADPPALSERQRVEGRQQVRPSPPVASPAARSGAAPMLSSDANEVIKTYCLTCHNDRVRRGELSLASFDLARVGEHADVGEKIVRKLRLGMMPPKEASRKPDAA